MTRHFDTHHLFESSPKILWQRGKLLVSFSGWGNETQRLSHSPKTFSLCLSVRVFLLSWREPGIKSDHIEPLPRQSLEQDAWKLLDERGKQRRKWREGEREGGRERGREGRREEIKEGLQISLILQWLLLTLIAWRELSLNLNSCLSD